MKKLKTLILAALTAVGACAAFGNNSYIEKNSTVWFDTSMVPDCSDYNTVYILRQDDYGEWVDNGSSLSSLQETYSSANFSDGSATEYDGGKLSFINDFLVASGTFSDPVVFLFTDNESGYFLVDGNCVTKGTTLDQHDLYKISMQEVNAFTSADLKPFDRPVISAVSAVRWLDLTVGDRVAADEETLVIDPAWGQAATAEVKIDGESSARTYTCASNDLWQTAALAAGRYALALAAGTDEETAAFWKTGDDWVVFDSSNITENVTFEAGKTYLVLGTNTVNGNTLTVTDRAKFAYGAGAAGFIGGTLDMPRRYRKETVEGDLYQIVEAIKGCAENPWVVGDDGKEPPQLVEAYTNGTDNLVIVGAGTITDLSEIPAGIEAIEIVDATVKGAEENAFAGFNNIALTLPDNWQGEIPEKGAWYGATGVELTRMPMAVKSVKVLQRYPWNGLVDVNYALTGEGPVKVKVQVTVDGKKIKNPTVTGETEFDLGTGKELKDLRLVWDAKADFGDAGVHEKIKVKLVIDPVESN